jgi:hypothetical protein
MPKGANAFDCIVVHYSVRLPFDQISESVRKFLCAYGGVKALFVQDEYDHTNKTLDWIELLGFHVVFSVVPSNNMDLIYPPGRFPGTRFVSLLTGYVTESMATSHAGLAPSKRELVVGYRGRPLSERYGQLGREKVLIGQMVRDYCRRNRISHDIAWDESSRIYGDGWLAFLAKCKATLGTESGSNIFDWNGDLASKIDEIKAGSAGDSAGRIVEFLNSLEQPGLMNQVSPKIFEAIASRTVLILFEGHYSGVVRPWVHYLPLKKDGSNLDEVFSALEDSSAVDAMAERAFSDLVCSGLYSYSAMVLSFDQAIAEVGARMPLHSPGQASGFVGVTHTPYRSLPPLENRGSRIQQQIYKLLQVVWSAIPQQGRRHLGPYLAPLIYRGVLRGVGESARQLWHAVRFRG